MANIKSQIKRNRQSAGLRGRNMAVRSSVKSFRRRFDQAVAQGDREAAEQAFVEATRAVDRAASKGVLHKNKAANAKSRMARRLTTL